MAAAGPAAVVERVEVASPRGWLGRVAVVAVVVLAFQAFTLWAAVDRPDGRWLYGGLAAATLVLSPALVVGVLVRLLRARSSGPWTLTPTALARSRRSKRASEP